MESEKYKVLLNEVCGYVDEQRLRVAVTEFRRNVRVDSVMDILRGAFLKSTIGMFNGVLYYYAGRIYERLSADDFGNLVYDVLRWCSLPNGDYSRMEHVIKILKRVVSVKELRPCADIVVFRNCVYDTRDNSVHDFGAEWVQLSYVDYDYDADARIFAWGMFLDRVLPDKVYQDVLQEYLGAMFVDRRKAKIETMMILKGSGSNGKSVVFETVMGILGKDNVSSFGIQALLSGTERKKNIASINGRRLNYCSEIQTLEFGKDSDTLKSLISGEPMEARHMYGDNFMADDLPLLMANANQLPFLKDTSYGMRRRICVIPFDIEIPKAEQNITLSRELVCEYPAIFNWIMEGRKRFVRNGYKLTHSKSLDALLDDYQAEGNNVLKFMYGAKYMCRYEDVVLDPVWISMKTLYREYVRWCISNGLATEKSNQFSRILTSAGYRKKRQGEGNVVAIYGKPLLDELRKQSKRLTMKDQKKDKNGIEVSHGRRYAHGLSALSRAIYLDIGTLTRAFKTGILNEFYTQRGALAVFDIDAVVQKMKDVGAYGKSELQKKEEAEKKEAMERAVAVFNNEMALQGLNIRKGYIPPAQRQRFIVVPDDWIFSEEAAQKLFDEREKELAAMRADIERERAKDIEALLDGRREFVRKTDDEVRLPRRKLSANKQRAVLNDHTVMGDGLEVVKKKRGRPRKNVSE